MIIADDHPIFLQGLVGILNEGMINVVGTAGNGHEVMDLFSKHDNIDICLLDVSMPVMDGVSTAKWMTENQPGTRIIVLTTYDEDKIVSEMLYIGASGYLLKTATKQEILDCIFRVMSGKLSFADEILAVTQLNESKARVTEEPGVLLTARENEILQLLAKEYSNDMIAETLNISYRTVETHRKNIMHKTKTRNLAGLVRYAYQNKLLVD